jgi:3-phosphoshikimate 1-carboxyvinyltransferase
MPLLTKTEVLIEDPEVVNKSYPSFWKHCELLSINLEKQTES